MTRRGICMALVALRIGTAEDTDEKAFKDARLQFQNLAARAIAAREALADLAARLREQGLTLRTDIVAARISMETALDDAEDELKSRRVPEARKSMKRAEGNLERIEAFLQGK